MANPENFYNQRSSNSDVQAGTPLSSQAYSERSLNQQPGNGSTSRDVSALGFPSTDALLDHTGQPGSMTQHVAAAFDDALSQSGSLTDFRKSFNADLKDLPADVQHDVNKHFSKDAKLALKDNTLKTGEVDTAGFLDELKGRIVERVNYLEGTPGGDQANSHGGKKHGHRGGHHALTASSDGTLVASSSSEGEDPTNPHARKKHGHHGGGHRGVAATDSTSAVATTSGEAGVSVSNSGSQVEAGFAVSDSGVAANSNLAISDTAQNVQATTVNDSSSQIYG